MIVHTCKQHESVFGLASVSLVGRADVHEQLPRSPWLLPSRVNQTRNLFIYVTDGYGLFVFWLQTCEFKLFKVFELQASGMKLS
jgi:hypothetical protein